MVNIISLLLIISIADVRSQFFDFLTAFQPQTLRPIFETTKLPKTTRFYDPNRSHNGSRKFGQISDQTTAKAIRKTTKNNRRIQNKTKKIKDNYGEKISFDDGVNTIINYDTDRHTTVNPFARPGVKPAVVNGPPITNRPVTTRSYVPRPIAGLQPSDDSSLTPELIVGPDEDYMSTMERRRYMEISEKKCEQYVSLDTVRVEAIPLVPSPRPVVVNVSSCARSVPLVVGGSAVTIQQFPHMALLGWTRMRAGGYLWKCGGSLVSERYVLTAAHCAYQDRDDSVVSGPPRAVQLGSSRRDDPGAIVIRVASVIRHPKYRPPQSYYDISIIKMMTTVKFSAVIKPACLGVPPSPGDHIIATGWGKTEFGGDESEQLRGVSLPVWSLKECASVLGESRKLPHGPDTTQTCAGDRRGGKDTCQGDSGGPAQRREGCSWRVIAVTSTGRACGAVDTPAIYANVQVPFVSKVIFGDEIRNEGNLNRNQWNEQNPSDGINNSNRQNPSNGINNSNRQNPDSGQNNYNRQNSNSGQNNYNRQDSNSGQNYFNRQNPNSGQNIYNRQDSNSEQTNFNRQNPTSGQDNYNRQDTSRDQNNHNRQNPNSAQDNYNRRDSNIGQNNYNRQTNQWYQQSTSNPARNEAWNNYQNPDNRRNNYENPDNRRNIYENSDNRRNNYENSDNRRNNYENPVFRRGDMDEDSTIGPHYFFEDSADRPYIGNIWQT